MCAWMSLKLSQVKHLVVTWRVSSYYILSTSLTVQNEMMDQPLAHLYFTVVLEHLLDRSYELKDLLDISDKLGQVAIQNL